MRTSRATELADKFPSNVFTASPGHTKAVIDEFYRQVTDDHFTKAISENIEFSVRKPINLLRDENLVALIGAGGIPLELATTFLSELERFLPNWHSRSVACIAT